MMDAKHATIHYLFVAGQFFMMLQLEREKISPFSPPKNCKRGLANEKKDQNFDGM